ncbi:PREDICTED: exopolygalacturonase-like [Tarenaya hassleriana]|uniref:exopolygalacturonase-like n=1 Tax=Tarenaya hassleriana TaxID=28532 RepID=UPI0008FD1B5C|nr:PREDICTED: exopolygalacturonase-like [Tarenaya hassleriana]
MAPSPKSDPPSDPPIINSRDHGVFDVTDYGATRNSETESSSAFLEAWDEACNHDDNETTFYVPEGRFLLGPITFNGPCRAKSAIKIELVGDLVALAGLEEFPTSEWIDFRQLNGIIIYGQTTIDGQGEGEAWKQKSCKKSAQCDRLITSLKLSDVSNAVVRDITLSNGKAFHVTIHGSRNITIHNVHITSPWDSPNTDGIHISHSSFVDISNSSIGVGDDCVSVGPGSFNISVSHLHCGPGHGISIGSLGRYKNEEDVRGIRVENCTLNGTSNGVRVKTWPTSPPSQARDMVFQNIAMNNVSNPIIIDQEYCPSHSCNMKSPSMVKLSDIAFKNISGTYNTEFEVTMWCSSAVPCENISLANVNLSGLVQCNNQQGRFSLTGGIRGLEVLSSSF